MRGHRWTCAARAANELLLQKQLLLLLLAELAVL